MTSCCLKLGDETCNKPRLELFSFSELKKHKYKAYIVAILLPKPRLLFCMLYYQYVS